MAVNRSFRSQDEEADRNKLLLMGGVGGGVLLLAMVALVYWLIGGGPPTGTTDPPAKLRLERVMEAFQQYTIKHNGRPPPTEQALKDFLNKLPQQERAAMNVGDDVDSLFVSPRDGQKYRLPYKTTLDPSGETRAVAWESTGQGGSRFVYLSMGYVQEYPDDEFQQLKKK
jgi:hypothetical protein